MNNKILIIPLFVATVSLAGCSGENASDDGMDRHIIKTDQLNSEQHYKEYGSHDKSLGEKGGYPQNDLSGTNAAKGNKNYSDIFTNEEADKIYNHLINQKEIKQVQVASANDKVIVGVMLSDHTDHNIRDKIEKEVRKVVPDKKIVVYTDDVHWDRLSNLKSKLGASKGGKNLGDQIKKLFNGGD